jgi:mono/diheme cytochrome c family protein
MPTLIACVFCACALAVAGHADEGTASKPAKPFDVKNIFRNICGFCHEDYGRHAGKGPQLMDDPNTDEFLVNRIKHGKPGRMAAFGSVFTDEQVHQIVVFIRSLKPGEEPQNP